MLHTCKKNQRLSFRGVTLGMMGFSCKVIIFYAFMLHAFHHISSKEEKIEDMGDISDIKTEIGNRWCKKSR